MSFVPSSLFSKKIPEKQQRHSPLYIYIIYTCVFFCLFDSYHLVSSLFRLFFPFPYNFLLLLSFLFSFCFLIRLLVFYSLLSLNRSFFVAFEPLFCRYLADSLDATRDVRSCLIHTTVTTTPDLAISIDIITGALVVAAALAILTSAAIVTYRRPTLFETR